MAVTWHGKILLCLFIHGAFCFRHKSIQPQVEALNTFLSILCVESLKISENLSLFMFGTHFSPAKSVEKWMSKWYLTCNYPCECSCHISTFCCCERFGVCLTAICLTLMMFHSTSASPASRLVCMFIFLPLARVGFKRKQILLMLRLVYLEQRLAKWASAEIFILIAITVVLAGIWLNRLCIVNWAIGRCIPLSTEFVSLSE